MPRPKGKLIAIAAGLLAVAILGIASWLSWPHIKFRWLFEPLGMNAQGYPEYRHRQTGIVMVRLPGGTFPMGAQKTDPKGQNYDPGAGDDEGLVHEVSLHPFLIGKYEVTQGQWRGAMGSDPSVPSRFKGDDRPVDRAFWDDIQRFQVKTGLTPPTEAQWEYACRGGASTPFAGISDEMSWHIANSGNTTHPVGTKAPNAFGIYDMCGNVWEWCVNIDPLDAKDFQVNTYRGGSWISDPCRSSHRLRLQRGLMFTDLGLRVAFPAP